MIKNIVLLLTINIFSVSFASSDSIYHQNIAMSSKSYPKFSTLEKSSLLLIVNIATKCGYTSQLSELESLYIKYKERGLVIMGIPSNDFGAQTPEQDVEIVKFCKLKYGVTFPLTKKVIVSGDKKIPLIDWLIKKSGGNEISWNFEKFLINKDGKFIKRYSSSHKPLESQLEKDIQKLLN